MMPSKPSIYDNFISKLTNQSLSDLVSSCLQQAPKTSAKILTFEQYSTFMQNLGPKDQTEFKSAYASYLKDYHKLLSAYKKEIEVEKEYADVSESYTGALSVLTMFLVSLTCVGCVLGGIPTSLLLALIMASVYTLTACFLDWMEPKHSLTGIERKLRALDENMGMIGSQVLAVKTYELNEVHDERLATAPPPEDEEAEVKFIDPASQGVVGPRPNLQFFSVGSEGFSAFEERELRLEWRGSQ